MRNKYTSSLIISSIFLVFALLIFGVLGIWPIIDFLTNNASAGHIVFIITIPLSSLLFIITTIIFLNYLMKYINTKKISLKKEDEL